FSASVSTPGEAFSITNNSPGQSSSDSQAKKEARAKPMDTQPPVALKGRADNGVAVTGTSKDGYGVIGESVNGTGGYFISSGDVNPALKAIGGAGGAAEFDGNVLVR